MYQMRGAGGRSWIPERISRRHWRMAGSLMRLSGTAHARGMVHARTLLSRAGLGPLSLLAQTGGRWGCVVFLIRVHCAGWMSMARWRGYEGMESSRRTEWMFLVQGAGGSGRYHP
jgi:hypothetical protein